jgi:hypothetical protein
VKQTLVMDDWVVYASLFGNDVAVLTAHNNVFIFDSESGALISEARCDDQSVM